MRRRDRESDINKTTSNYIAISSYIDTMHTNRCTNIIEQHYINIDTKTNHNIWIKGGEKNKYLYFTFEGIHQIGITYNPIPSKLA
jgi:hypothetical protein